MKAKNLRENGGNWHSERKCEGLNDVTFLLPEGTNHSSSRVSVFAGNLKATSMWRRITTCWWWWWLLIGYVNNWVFFLFILGLLFLNWVCGISTIWWFQRNFGNRIAIAGGGSEYGVIRRAEGLQRRRRGIHGNFTGRGRVIWVEAKRSITKERRK